MTKNPILNAISASVYIIGIVLLINYAMQAAPHSKSILIPMAMISLFTLSAAVMGYLFVYQPGQLYFEGKKKQAVNLFLQTVGVFGGITAILLALLFSGIL